MGPCSPAGKQGARGRVLRFMFLNNKPRGQHNLSTHSPREGRNTEPSLKAAVHTHPSRQQSLPTHPHPHPPPPTRPHPSSTIPTPQTPTHPGREGVRVHDGRQEHLHADQKVLQPRRHVIGVVGGPGFRRSDQAQLGADGQPHRLPVGEEDHGLRGEWKGGRGGAGWRGAQPFFAQPAQFLW